MKDPWELAVPSNVKCAKTQRLVKFRSENTLDEALRLPILEKEILRSVLLEHRAGEPLLKAPMNEDEEFNLVDVVESFSSAYNKLCKTIKTSFPFPLLQKSRTILLFWLFTIPLSLMREDDPSTPYDDMLMVFIITYGFLGLEYASSEMDDPFGDDPNDFDNLGMAQRVYEVRDIESKFLFSRLQCDIFNFSSLFLPLPPLLLLYHTGHIFHHP